MVAASRDSSSTQQPQQQQPQPQQQQPQPQQQQQAVLPVEDEALKRNTDCVYFLASPLTCKKGIECEYRHSEEARMNPRDCYYWLNGNCLNPKCAFRHPPLDGLIGTQAVGLTGPSLPTSQTAVPINANYNPGRQLAAASAPFNLVKQAVPCIFFFKGLCVKGDRCAFSHGLNPATNKFTRDPAAVPVHEPSNLKKTFVGLQKCSNEPKPQTTLQKPNHEVAPKAKPAPTLETALSNNRNFGQKIDLAPGRFNGRDSGHINTHFSQVTNGNNTMVWSNHMHQPDVFDDQSLPNGSKDADDFYKESSPGFDVLVDDELRDTEYYHDEDQFGRRGHEGRNLTEFDVGGSSDYNRVADTDREIIADRRGYDSYDRTRGKHNWNQRREEYLPDRKSSDPLEMRRGYVKSVSPKQIEESDLRYRLSKQRRVNGLKSVISHDHSHRNHDEKRRYGDSSRDSRHLSSNERSHSSRFRGRLSIPSRPNDNNNVRSDRDMDRERSFNRFSPGRPQSLSHQGRLPDRLRGRVQDDIHRRDRMPDARTDFSGPKSLAELKVGKNGEGKEKQTDSSLGKRKHSRNYQPSEEDLSFDGPKPLSEILKRKRGDIEPVTVVEDVNPTIKTDSAHVEPHVESHVESQVVDSTTVLLELDEGGLEEDQYELEEYDQNDAELDEVDYNLEEGDNAYQEEEEEYIEEEDGEDDFAKKIGIMFS